MAYRFFNPTERRYLEDLRWGSLRKERVSGQLGKNFKSNLRKKISVKMAPVFMNYIEDWLLLDEVCRELDSKLRLNVREETGDNYQRICDYLIAWMPRDRLSDFYNALLVGAPYDRGDPLDGGPKTSISAIAGYLDSISFDGKEAETCRKEALDRLQCLIKEVAQCRLLHPTVTVRSTDGSSIRTYRYQTVPVLPDLMDDLKWIENAGKVLTFKQYGQYINGTKLRVAIRLRINIPGYILRSLEVGKRDEVKGMGAKGIDEPRTMAAKTIDDIIFHLVEYLEKKPLMIVERADTDVGVSGMEPAAERTTEERRGRKTIPEVRDYLFIWSEPDQDLIRSPRYVGPIQYIELEKIICQLKKMTRSEGEHRAIRRAGIAHCLEEMEWKGLVRVDGEFIHLTKKGSKIVGMLDEAGHPELAYRIFPVHDDE